MATQFSHSPTGPLPETLAVRVYAGIRRDYVARGVFPEVCRSVAFTFEGTATYNVRRTMALEMFADAKAQHARTYGKSERGMKKSYCALIEALDRTLHPEVWAKRDAEAAEARHRMQEQMEAERAARYAFPTQGASGNALGLLETVGFDAAKPPTRADGLWDDPGALAMRFRMQDSPAQFKDSRWARRCAIGRPG